MTARLARTARPLAATALALALTAATPPVARAQSCDCPAPVYPARWSVFLATGAGTMETTTLNALLAGAGGYYALSDDAISLGVGGYTSFGPLRLGAEYVQLVAGRESAPSGRHAWLESRYAMATVGWDLRPFGRLSLAPTLGVGRGQYVLGVGDRAGGAPAAGTPTFPELLADPGTETTIAGGHWIYEPMIAADLVVVRLRGQRGGITIGARAGYRIAPNRPEWRARGEAVAGGPVDQAKGPILRITFGIGGR
ncbi:MAG: hypothetical protein K1X31_00130 [Gemmatimonadaceae bacterium]|nr:hypothetical protein [Gemmatimonadaceae bacterium]